MDATQWHLFFSARKPFEPLFRKVESINTCKQDNHARARAHIWEQRCTQCKVVLVTGKWSWSRCLCWCALLKDSCNGTVFIELYPHNWSFFLFFLEDWYDTYTKAGNLHHLVYSLYFVSHQSHCDTFRGVSEPGEEDVTIPSRALDSRANSIGLTPPRSCGTCPQAFLTTARVSACPVLSGGARALSTSPPPSHSPASPVRSSLDSQDQPAARRTLPESVWPPSNMSPAWTRGRRTGGSTVAPRTMVTAGRTGQVGQVWVSCWILLSATCFLGARAQGKMLNSCGAVQCLLEVHKKVRARNVLCQIRLVKQKQLLK